MLLYRMRHTPHEIDIIDAEPAYLREPRTCERGQQQARTVAGVHIASWSAHIWAVVAT